MAVNATLTNQTTITKRRLQLNAAVSERQRGLISVLLLTFDTTITLTAPASTVIYTNQIVAGAFDSTAKKDAFVAALIASKESAFAGVTGVSVTAPPPSPTAAPSSPRGPTLSPAPTMTFIPTIAPTSSPGGTPSKPASSRPPIVPSLSPPSMTPHFVLKTKKPKVAGAAAKSKAKLVRPKATKKGGSFESIPKSSKATVFSKSSKGKFFKLGLKSAAPAVSPVAPVSPSVAFPTTLPSHYPTSIAPQIETPKGKQKTPDSIAMSKDVSKAKTELPKTGNGIRGRNP